MSANGTLDELSRLRSELQRREREILEAAYLRRSDGIERVRDAVRRLGELGSPTGIIRRAGQELGSGSQFDRILLSQVEGGRMTPLTVWDRDDATPLPECVVALDYPLVENDVVRNRQSQLVDVLQASARTPPALTEALRWESYAVAPITAEGQVIGLLHADATASGRPLDDVDRELVQIACTGLGEVFDRAVLRETLHRHRAELQSAVAWLSSRLRSSTDGRGQQPTIREGADMDAVDSLTPREREILGLMSRGLTNAAIAEALVVREGTVKYHVKNVLRKLSARSRADAVAKYTRATGSTPR